MEPQDLAFEAARILDSKKATDILVLDVHELVDIAEYFVIASASNNRQVDALIDYVEEGLKAQGAEFLQLEGREECTWALLDYGPVMVHIFQPETRDFYRLENMWRQAPAYTVDEGGIIALEGQED